MWCYGWWIPDHTSQKQHGIQLCCNIGECPVKILIEIISEYNLSAVCSLRIKKLRLFLYNFMKGFWKSRGKKYLVLYDSKQTNKKKNKKNFTLQFLTGGSSEREINKKNCHRRIIWYILSSNSKKISLNMSLYAFSHSFTHAQFKVNCEMLVMS